MIAFEKGYKKKDRQANFDYHHKKLENPFYSGKKKINHFGDLKNKLVFIAGLLLFLFLAWFFFASSYWKIKEISIEGLDKIPDNEILKLTNEWISGRNWLVLPQNNLLFFNEKKFLSLAGEKYRFQEIKTKKHWPDKLSIEVKEKTITCIWKEDNIFYLLDSEGYLISEINPLELTEKKYPLIVNESGLKIDGGKIKTELIYLEAAKKIFDIFAEKAPEEIVIKNFVVDNEINTIKLATEEGVMIFFNTETNPERQIEKFLIVKKEKLGEDFKNKKYIDLRFGDKIYFQ